MKYIDHKIRTIHVYIEHHEIVDAIRQTIYSSLGIEISKTDYFSFEFVKEGSPEYTTNKIKCKVTKQIDLNAVEE